MASVVVPCAVPCTQRRRRTCACAGGANAASASLMALGAAARQSESLRSDRLFDDPYAQHLVRTPVTARRAVPLCKCRRSRR
jgi:hypothetical protein